MRVELQPGYILHTRPYRDTSLLVDVLTPDFGRLSLIARGARRPKQKIRYWLQPFIPVILSWQGKHALKTLIDIEGGATTPMLEGSKLYSAMYINELLVYLLREEDHQSDYYVLYQRVLEAFAGSDDIESILRYFEFSLLESLGYGINFSTDANSGHGIDATKYYRFKADTGFIHESDGSYSPRYTGSVLAAVEANDLNLKDVRLAAKAIARQALAPHLNGRVLKSRELFK